MKLLSLVILVVIFSTPWVWNFKKLTDCDFEKNYKCEVIHGIGVVVPPSALITVWFSTDENK